MFSSSGTFPGCGNLSGISIPGWTKETTLENTAGCWPEDKEETMTTRREQADCQQTGRDELYGLADPG